jgi:hypothetical protein
MNTPRDRAIASWRAWNAIPFPDGRKLPHGFRVLRGAKMYVRDRALLVDENNDRLAVVWADCWKAAYEAIIATGEVPQEFRCPPQTEFGEEE